jgi:hypothetical protein
MISNLRPLDDRIRSFLLHSKKRTLVLTNLSRLPDASVCKTLCQEKKVQGSIGYRSQVVGSGQPKGQKTSPLVCRMLTGGCRRPARSQGPTTSKIRQCDHQSDYPNHGKSVVIILSGFRVSESKAGMPCIRRLSYCKQPQLLGNCTYGDPSQ